MVSAQQSDLLASVINTMSEGVYVMNAEGKTLLHNPRLTEIFAHNIADFGPEDWQREYNITTSTGEDFSLNDFPAVRVLAGEVEAVSEMIVTSTDSGRTRVLRVTARPLGGEDGDIKGAVCISTDITDQKQIELKLRLAIEQAESASKAKGHFVANMSHEIRTPMNAVLGMAQLLVQTPLAADQRKYIDMIIMSGRMLLNILNDILDYSKIEAGKMDIVPVQFRLNDVIHSLAAIMGIAAGKKNIELVIDVDPSVPPILMGDSHRLQQILVNLVSNAIKFTESGEVVVAICCADRQADSVKLHFAVKDTGLGMSQEQQARLFSAFTQADTSITRKFGGTGLGLTISRRLVDLMNGSISLRSKAGVGSEFAITLPFTVCNDIERRAYPRQTLGNLSLLIIEENYSARHAAAKICSTWGWLANVAASASEGSSLINTSERSESKYDALLVDWQTVINEKKAIARIIAESELPIIVMTSLYGQPLIEAMVAQKELKPDAIILKPMTCLSLFEAINGLSKSVRANEGMSEPTAMPQYLQGVSILLAEDNEFNQVVARDFLQKYGASVDIVDDGQKALDVLRVNPSKYQLILMDVQMPVMDGFTATEKIRSELQLLLPIIAMTAGVTERERESCISCGMNDLIAKPIEADKMLATILRNLSQKLASQIATSPTEGTPKSDSEYFDISKLLRLGGDDPSYRTNTIALVRGLLTSCITSFEHAKTALDNKDFEKAGRVLHTLRGSLGMIGATAFVNKALALEALLQNVNGTDHKNALNELEGEMLRTVELAREWLKMYDDQDTNP